jgi:hypothetical protein
MVFYEHLVPPGNVLNSLLESFMDGYRGGKRRQSTLAIVAKNHFAPVAYLKPIDYYGGLMDRTTFI